MGQFPWGRKITKAHFQKLPLLENHFADTPISADDYPHCTCFHEYHEREKSPNAAQSGAVNWGESMMHVDPPAATQRAWDVVLEIIDEASSSRAKEINLGKRMDRADFKALNTLPDSIGTLKDLEKLVIYGSNISVIPRAISGCENLRIFQPYTSYRLHWLPYEIGKCRHLGKSTISTRALYGNYKMRPPFPDLSKYPWTWPTEGGSCSLCGNRTRKLDQFWISQRIATDIVPLLVSVCGDDCMTRIGSGSDGYVKLPHRGGLGLHQPAAQWMGRGAPAMESGHPRGSGGA